MQPTYREEDSTACVCGGPLEGHGHPDLDGICPDCQPDLYKKVTKQIEERYRAEESWWRR
jgi:hypothetical protein